MIRTSASLVAITPLRAGCATRGPTRPGVARGLALAGTAATVVAPIVAGLAMRDDDTAMTWLPIAGVIGGLVGPSLGHFYAGKTSSRGLQYRFGGLGVVAGGALVLGLACSATNDLARCIDDTPAGVINTGLAAGALLFVFGVGDDIATADDAARAANRKNTRARDTAPGTRPIVEE